MTPQVAEDSTYEVVGGYFQGTAWVVDPTHLMTAGHVCVSFELAGQPVFAVSNTRRFVPVTVGAFEMSDGPEADLCLLSTSAGLAPPLPLAAYMPITGDSVGFVGYPDGKLDHETGIFRYPDVSTAACDHGASGSAEYDAAGVWGVLVQSLSEDPTGASGCRSTTLSEIRAFLAAGGVWPWVLQFPDDYAE
jgi:hypothetical protein